MKKIYALALAVVVLTLSSCRMGSFISQVLVTSTPTPTETTLPTKTSRPTFTLLPTVIVEPTRTSTLTPRPTSTRRPAATVARLIPTSAPQNTAAPLLDYVFDEGSIIPNPNCDVYLEGRVINGNDGSGIKGVIVEISFSGLVFFNASGEERSDDAFDKWGFSPIGKDQVFNPFTFKLRVVSSKESNRKTLSPTLTITKPADCNLVGQWTNIIIKKIR